MSSKCLIPFTRMYTDDRLRTEVNSAYTLGIHRQQLRGCLREAGPTPRYSGGAFSHSSAAVEPVQNCSVPCPSFLPPFHSAYLAYQRNSNSSIWRPGFHKMCSVKALPGGNHHQAWEQKGFPALWPPEALVTDLTNGPPASVPNSGHDVLRDSCLRNAVNLMTKTKSKEVQEVLQMYHTQVLSTSFTREIIPGI